ncbi:MAG: purine-nucleoside phosphorylase [Acidobacteriota bacterium]|jgi:purine-nucleoside phosphorylase
MTTEAQIRSLDDAIDAWDARGWPRPKVCVVSGSGLAVDLHPPTHAPVPLAEVLPFPIHAVPGHPHQVEMLAPDVDDPDGAGRPVAYFRGRLHSYQGYDAFQTVFAVRLAALLGAETLIMTNASGSLSRDLPAGTLVTVEDHLNLTGLNPLRGHLPESWGPRFPDMTDAHDPRLRELARSVAGTLDVELASGVYAGLAGPSYETPAEVRMLAALGADLVGMSTVLEVIAARHLGVRCLVLSLVSNLAAGVTAESLDHEEVLQAGREASGRVRVLLKRLLEAETLTR